jgi:hypothetical protein
MKVETFFKLEDAFLKIVDDLWSAAVKKAWPDVRVALDNDDLEGAIRLINGITIADPLEKKKPSIRLIMRACLNYGAGAAQSGGLKKSIFIGEDPEFLDDVMQMFAASAQENVKRYATKMAAAMARKLVEQELVEKSVVLKAIDSDAIQQSVLNGGRVIASVGANQTTSRLASFGALSQLSSQGIVRYRLQATLDKRTSKICRRMHGKSFSVQVGMAHIQQVIRITDPDDLRTADPWIPATKDQLAMLEKLDESGLVSQKWHVPPFHPSCRTIVVDADVNLSFAQANVGLPKLPIRTPDTPPQPSSVSQMAKTYYPEDMADTLYHEVAIGERSALYAKTKARNIELGKDGNEYLLMRKSDGTWAGGAKGKTDRVALTADQWKILQTENKSKTRDLIAHHNHPRVVPMPFSPDDFRMIIQNRGIRQVFAHVDEGTSFMVEWSPIMDDVKFLPMFEKFTELYFKEYAENMVTMALRRGIITKEFSVETMESLLTWGYNVALREEFGLNISGYGQSLLQMLRQNYELVAGVEIGARNLAAGVFEEMFLGRVVKSEEIKPSPKRTTKSRTIVENFGFLKKKLKNTMIKTGVFDPWKQ